MCGQGSCCPRVVFRKRQVVIVDYGPTGAELGEIALTHAELQTLLKECRFRGLVK